MSLRTPQPSTRLRATVDVADNRGLDGISRLSRPGRPATEGYRIAWCNYARYSVDCCKTPMSVHMGRLSSITRAESEGEVGFGMAADDLVRHLERHLGPMDGGWSTDTSGAKLHTQIVRFTDASSSGLVSFATLGLSRYELALTDGRVALAELVMSCWETHAYLGIPPVLSLVADDIAHSGTMPPRGSVLGPDGPLFEDSSLTALYVAMPVFFPDDFHVYEGSTPPTVMVQLIPITTDEAAMASESGWETFESHLERSDPDLFDLHRASSRSD
jgi:hypothetical protein